MLAFYYWFKNDEKAPRLFDHYCGDVGEKFMGKEIVDWTYEEVETMFDAFPHYKSGNYPQNRITS